MIRYFDAHCDTITTALDKNVSLYKNDLHISIENLRRFKKYSGVFAIWQGDEIRGEAAFLGFLKYLNYFKSEIEKNNQYIMFCKDIADYNTSIKHQKISAFLSIESGCALAGDIENLEKVYNEGVKILTLTWNGENELSGGIGDNQGLGLSDFGKQVVKQMQKLKMIVDVSHVSEKGFYDVFENTNAMVIASHSNSKAICEHRRNITDKQFEMLKNCGGGVGINFYSQFLTNKDSATLSDCLNHIEHFMSLGGMDSVFIGADYDGIESTAIGLENVIKVETLYNELLKHNYKESLVRKIFYDNLEKIIISSL